jgi:DNA/RNA endonuclease G (NUC1)
MTSSFSRAARAVATALVVLSCSPEHIAGPLAVSGPRLNQSGSVSSVVISQVFGGGGNANSIFRNDFIEILNNGQTTVSLAGWSVQYASAAGTTWAMTPLSGSIVPGHYLLIQEAVGAGTTQPLLPTPDFTGTIAMSATDAKVALVRSTTLLNPCGTAAVPCNGGSVADFVGYGSATYFEGTGAVGVLANTTAALRNGSGCTDTNVNSADFTRPAPAPRNAATTPVTCPGSIPLGPLDHVAVSGPSTVLAGGTAQMTGTPQDANNQTVPTATVTWVSSDNTLATVSSTGLVTGVAAGGPVTITATAVDNAITKTGSAQITVNNPGINWLDVSYSAPSLLPGFQAQMFLTARVASGGQIVPATFSVVALDPTYAVALNLPSGSIVMGVASPTDGSHPRFQITATPTAGGTPYVFTTGTSTSLAVDAPVFAPASTYSVNDEFGDPSPASAGTANDLLITRPQYTLSYNESRGTPNWVSYELDSRQLVAGADRCNCFTSDPNLPSDKQIYTSDYTNGGFDRGHMTRSADRTTANMENAATFYLTNVVPQQADLNQGVWAQFENMLGDSATKGGRAVYIIVGPHFSANPATLKNEGKVAIPDSTWKVALIGPRDANGVPFSRANIQTWDDLRGITVLAVNMPNVAGVRNDLPSKYFTTIDKIEASTGLDFLSLLPVAFQTAIEAGDHAPTASFTSTGAGPFSLDASASTDPDIGVNPSEALTYTWSFSDGTTGTGKTFTKSFATNGSYTATLTVTDVYGWQSTATHSLSVANIPVAVWGGSTTGAEGAPVAFDGTGSSDPDGDALTYAWDFGDGSSGTGAQPSHTYQDNGTYTVTMTVTDTHSAHGTASNSVTISNVAPTATFASPGAVNEGSSFTLSLSSPLDPSSADVAAGFQYRFNCGAGFGSWSATASASCPTSDNGTLSTAGEVRDKDGGVSSYSGSVTVNNVAPTAIFSNTGPANEASSFNLLLSSPSDPSSADVAAGFQYRFDCGSGFGAWGSASGTTCATNNDGIYHVGGEIRDKDLAVSSYAADVTVNNVAPTIGAFAGASLLPGETYSTSGSFTDPGPDSWTATVNYGDGSGSQSLSLSGKSFSLSHTYTAAGTFTVTVSVSDGEATSTQTSTVVVESASQGIQDAGAIISQLQSGGTINGGNANSLQSKLNAALNQLAGGNTRAAANQLRSLLNEVDAMVTSGRLSASDANALRVLINRVLESIG